MGDDAFGSIVQDGFEALLTRVIPLAHMAGSGNETFVSCMRVCGTSISATPSALILAVKP